MIARIFLVRHGETSWSLSGRHTGHTDVPLTEQGKLEARGLAARLGSLLFSRVFASPLQRVRQTCELAGFASRAEMTPDLLEWDYGDYEGLLTADIRRMRPAWNIFRDGAPGGESPQQVAARADHFLAEACAAEGDVVAFSSAHITRMIIARWLGLPPLATAYFSVGTASITVLGFEHDRGQPMILMLNDSYLERQTPPKGAT